jgi:hypothetical protein
MIGPLLGEVQGGEGEVLMRGEEEEGGELEWGGVRVGRKKGVEDMWFFTEDLAGYQSRVGPQQRSIRSVQKCHIATNKFFFE